MAHDSVECAARFLGYFEQVKLLHQQAFGRPLEYYKPTEPDCLTAVFDRLLGTADLGEPFVTEMLHSLVWGQCLGNANHRTTILFLQAFLTDAGIEFPRYASAPDADLRFQGDLNRWMVRSHALLEQRGEPGVAQARLEPTHREETRRWLRELLGDQSMALMTLGPQRLMTFISSTEGSRG